MDRDEANKITGIYNYEEGQSRPKGDFYATPRVAIEGLLSKEQFGHTILEPCCGNGAISKVLEEYGYEVISKDLYDWGFGEVGKDFLTEPVTNVDAVVTNPPFNLSMEFTLRALECTKENKGKVAILNRVQWLESVKRKKMFEGNPLSCVWVFSRRIPRMHRYDHKGPTTTSVIAFAWYVFDWNYTGEPRLGWI